jgi:3-hydroxy-9,10-secoandrosta-1,3,5(10)-triene-9,17-dione monooxygenase reductase component
VPGDPFEGISFSPSPHGPVLDGVSALAGCSLVGYLEAGYSLLVRGLIDHVGVTAGAAPLIHYRGRYTTLADRR